VDHPGSRGVLGQAVTQVPSHADQIVFLTRVQKVLDEGQFVATYKFALLIALIDIAIERGDDSGASLDVELEWLAEKFIELHWNHSKPFGGAVLSQNKGSNIAVLGHIQTLQTKTMSLAEARKVTQWRATLRGIGQIIQAMPLFRLQLLRGDQRLPFIYDEQLVNGTIRLKPGVAYCLRKFSMLVGALARNGWLREVRDNPRNAYAMGVEPAVRDFVRAAVTHLSAKLEHEAVIWERDTRWERGTDGHFRERNVLLRQVPMLRVTQPLESMHGYGGCVQLIESDAVLSAHINCLVGTSISAMRLELDNILWSLVYAMFDDNGELRFVDERFDTQWRRQVEFFTATQVTYKTIAPLPFLVVPNPPLQLNTELSLDKLTEDEVSRCFQVGVLRPHSLRFPLIVAEEAVGIRATKVMPKVVRTENAPNDLPDAGNLGTFGHRPPLLENVAIEDVVSALRLFKHTRVRVAGHASWTDSWLLSGGTSYRCLSQWPYGGGYELTEAEVSQFLELWSHLERWADVFAFGIRRFNLAFERDLLEDRIVDLVIAAESLFLGEIGVQDRGELRFRFALRAAKFIEHPVYGQRDVYRIMRRAYHARSAVVHGGSPDDTRLPNNDAATFTAFTDEIEELVRLALRVALAMKANGKNLRQSEYWDNLLFHMPQ
jgi:Apea-like HEPN